MFEKTLAAQLKRILKLDKVTFDEPGESQEQEAAFIQVTKCLVRFKDARQIARVSGKLRIFANADKMPYGYLAKAVAAAETADTRGLFFFNFEENKGTFRNIAERGAEFLYLFDSQFDPNVGTLNQINLSISEST